MSASKSVRSQSKEDIVLNKFSRTTRTAAVAAIAGLSLSLSMPAAFAEEPVAAAATASDSPLVNPNLKGMLTIHKYADLERLGTPTGTIKDAESISGEKLDGVEFTIYKIKDIDLTTNGGIAAATKKTAADYVTAGVVDSGKVTQIKKETTRDGKIVLSDLPLGAYLVVETGPLQGYTPTPAIPFVAYVPMTEGNSGDNQGVKWNYDVHAFPKNFKEEKPSKAVEDKDQNADDTVVYTVSGTVRRLAEGEKLTQFEIADQVDKKLQVTDVKVFLGDVELDKDSYENPTFTENNVHVKLTAKGLSQLVTGAKVSVTITTKVLSSIEDLKVENSATVYQNKPGGQQDTTGTPTPTVRTYWGGVQFKKVDKEHGGYPELSLGLFVRLAKLVKM